MSTAQANKRLPTTVDARIVDEALLSIAAGKSVRRDLENGGRLHIDRALPFLCVYVSNGRDADAALDVASANASYLIAPDLDFAVSIVEAIGSAMVERFGAFVVLDVGELAQDRLLSDDAPYLPPFEITLSASDQPGTHAAVVAFTTAIERVEAKFRSPRLNKLRAADDPQAHLAARTPGIACVTIRFAPIYRVPGSCDIYPDLRERLVANIFDAGLQAVTAFLKTTGYLNLPTHRALGRRAFVDTVERADRSIDDIAATFDFLLAVTPINAGAAWQDFKSNRFQRPPRLLYRPLTVQVDVEKKKLFSIAFNRFEDPVLFNLYREKRHELDLQLSMLSARETPRFVEFGRALYGRVEPGLLDAAKDILEKTVNPVGVTSSDCGDSESVDCEDVERASRAMIEMYRRQYSGFEATVELRDDLPAGLLVSGARLLISRSTKMTRQRLRALLSHEIGVHLLTYFNGSAQGLRLFRTGLAGYEGVQEGLAVLAEYLVGGMTTGRLRVIAARVVACAAMLQGASFQEVFHSLVRDYGFSETGAFHLALRLYRGGGLAKDAIYLRGLLEVLNHLRSGGALDPFWMGKIAASHFSVMQELNTRGLLRAPAVRPAFLSHQQATKRLEKARSGILPVEMIASS
ncbi:MAG: flavohemoglobin expression-modulating QEGLA motif protein [Phyllobacterium sp.]|uniref:flavohemoglobin expression-modulating QEGLA motif protein n=1 Tax=Phyllobacterium sp. TaxID=1871046 RepID=UPI0030F1DCD5